MYLKGDKIKLGDYNKVKIMHTKALNKELGERFEELIKIKYKIKSAFQDYLSKISLNKDVPAQDPCVECMVKPSLIWHIICKLQCNALRGHKF